MAKMTFETAMKQLEKIVQGLEEGDLTLDNALKKFEEGMRLAKFCSEQLDQADKQIALLLKDEQGNLSESDFEDGK